MTPDGAVRAMVGGRNYAESQFNRAVTAKRQPGSAFKPFVYLTAIEAGLTPETIRQDAPLDVKGWKPENYTHEYFGAVTLTQALAMSLNTVAVRLGARGRRRRTWCAPRTGSASPRSSRPTPRSRSAPRKCRCIELVGAYAPFANGGAGVVAACRRAGSAPPTARCCTRGTRDQLGQVIDPRHVGDDEHDDAGDAARPAPRARRRSRAGRPPARPAPARISATPGSSATPPISSPASGSAMTTTRRPRRRPAAACRSKSGRRFMRAAHQGVPVAALPSAGQPGGAMVSTVAQTASARRGAAPQPAHMPPRQCRSAAAPDRRQRATEPGGAAGSRQRTRRLADGSAVRAVSEGRCEARASAVAGGRCVHPRPSSSAHAEDPVFQGVDGDNAASNANALDTGSPGQAGVAMTQLFARDRAEPDRRSSQRRPYSLMP